MGNKKTTNSKTTTKKTSTKKKTVRLYVDPTVSDTSNEVNKSVTSEFDTSTNNVTTNKVIEDASLKQETTNVVNNNNNQVNNNNNQVSNDFNNKVKTQEVTNNNNVGITNNKNTNINKNNSPIKPPKKKKGFWKHLGFTERFIFILLIVFTVAVAAGIPLYTYVFNKTVSVIFDPNYEGSSTFKQEVKKDEKVTKPEDPIRDKYAFIGWSKKKDKQELYNFDEKVTSSFTLYGTWVKEYTVTFISNCEEIKDKTSKVKEGESVSKPTDYLREDYLLLSWHKDQKCEEEAYNFDTPVTSDLTLYAKWRTKKVYTFNFNLNYEGSPTPPETQTIKETGLVKEPQDIKRDYYNFDGWYTDNETFKNKFDFSKPIVGDTLNVTLYAKWNEIKYIASFYSNAGGKEYTLLETQQIALHETRRFTPLTPQDYPHHTFMGWYPNKECEGEPYDFNKDATGDVNLYSKYEINVYNVTYHLYDDVTKINKVKYGDKISKPVDPSYLGHKFINWYTKEEGGEVFNFDTYSIQSDVDIYAHWEVTDLDSIRLEKITKTIFIPDEELNNDNFVIYAKFSNDEEFEIKYSATEGKGYQISSDDIASLTSLPYTFLGADSGKEITLKFTYTYNGTTEKSSSITQKIIISDERLDVIPCVDSGITSEKITPDYSLLNVDNTNTTSFYLYIGNYGFQELQKFNFACYKDGTSISYGALEVYTHKILPLIKYTSTSSSFPVGSATITIKKVENDKIIKAGSIPLEFGSNPNNCMSYISFSTFYEAKFINGFSTSGANAVKFSIPSRRFENNSDDEMSVLPVKGISGQEVARSSYYNDISELYIPKEIKYIDDYVFACQKSLKKVVFDEDFINGSDPVTIGDYAFMYCSILQEITFSNSIVSIGESAFERCCFQNSPYVTFNIPSKIKYIMKGAFKESYLRTITLTIPSTCEYIGIAAFGACNSDGGLFSVHFEKTDNWKLYKEDETYYKTIDQSEFSNDTRNKQLLVFYDNVGTYTKGYANYKWIREA